MSSPTDKSIAGSAPGPVPNIVPGCVMMGVVALVVIGLVTFAVMTGVRMDREIGAFASDEPREFSVAQPDEAMLGTLRAKLDTLEEAALAHREVEIAFDREELNALIATQPMLQDMRGRAFVDRITPESVVVSMSQPVRKLGKGERYVNGEFHFVPAIMGERHWWRMSLVDIDVPGRAVPQGFIDMIEGLRLFRFDQENPELQQVMKQITEMRLEDGRILVVTADQDLEALEAAGTKAQKDADTPQERL